MSQLFETDINKWLPDDVSVPAEDSDKELGRVVGFLAVSLHKVLERVERAEQTIEQLGKDQLRLLDLMEKMVEMDKIRAKAFDLLDERVKRAAVHAGLRQQAIDALNARVGRAEDLATLRQQVVDLLRERVTTLEEEVRNG